MKDKIKQRFKKIVPYILIAVLSSTAVLFSYDKGNEVHAMVGVDDVALAGLVTAILMSYGYVTLDYYNNTDGSSALADDWEEAYEQARFQVLNGGGSGDNNDDDNDDDWEDTDGDGKITEKDIPKFNQLYNPTSGASALGATFLITANAGKLLAPIVSKFMLGKCGGVNYKPNDEEFQKSSIKLGRAKLDSYLSDNNIDISSYPYRFVDYDYIRSGGRLVANQVNYCYCSKGYGYHSKDGNDYYWSVKHGLKVSVDLVNDMVVSDSDYSASGGFAVSSKKYWYSNLPKESGVTSDSNWIDPNIGDGFDNDGKLELLPPPHSTDISSYNIPTQQALQDLLNNLNNPNLLPEQQKQTLLDFINNLGNKPDPGTGKDPDKNPDPDPNPKPDPGTGKDPDKNPDPDPNPKPDPNPDTGKDTDNNAFTADLKELFPFCIPFDIVDCFRLFNAEPETPRVKVPIHFGIVDKDYTFDIDLKDFNDVAGVCRTSFLILFMVGLGFATSRVIKW